MLSGSQEIISQTIPGAAQDGARASWLHLSTNGFVHFCGARRFLSRALTRSKEFGPK